MKKTLCKATSLLLVLAMVICMIPAVVTHARAETVYQQNIVDRADYMYNITWVCQTTVDGWCGEYTFTKGNTYRIPYGQPVYSGAYIGYGVTVDDFLAAAADGSSVFYTSQSTYASYYSTYYANDCSAFVSWCWGIARNTTYSIPNYATYIGMANSTNVYSLELGDALNSNEVGHVVLVTDLIYTNGVLTSVEITEQTPPQLKRSYYTPSELAAKYGTYYGIYRYEGAVPEAPVSGYLSECTDYAAHGLIELTDGADVYSLPCDSVSNGEASLIGTAEAQAVYTVTALYENTEGELWYEIRTADGKGGYLPAENTAYIEELTSDITLTNADVPKGHVQGNIFYVTGSISAQYNRLDRVSVYVHEGFGIDGAVITGDSATPNGNAYTLDNSTIDNNTAFDTVPLGANTYVISADYTNYYVDEDGSIASNSGTVYLLEAYFMVVQSSMDQAACVHNDTETVLRESSCTETGTTLIACDLCGRVEEQTVEASGHSYGEWENTVDATCTAEGVRSRVCGTCGDVQTETVDAAGHSHESEHLDADCLNYERDVYTCAACGDSYTVYTGDKTEWAESVPEDVDPRLIEEKTQYRSSRYETLTSTESTLEGYELVRSGWADSGEEKTVLYVKEWPDGFDRNHELYEQYNQTPVEETETDVEKTVIQSDEVVGYLYYHWCGTSDIYSEASSSTMHPIFHAYYSTTQPSSYRCDTSDNSYCTADACCSSSQWFFVAEVNAQTCTVYPMEYVHGRWSDWSAWTDESVEAGEECMVEIRTMYRYVNSELGEHRYVDGVCSVCGEAEQAAEPELFNISFASMTMGNSLAINFAFEQGHVSEWTGYYAEITKVYADGRDDAVEIVSFEDWKSTTINDVEHYYVTFNGVAAKEMTDNVYVTIYNAAGEAVSNTWTDSVRAQAMRNLARETISDLEKTMVVDMLNYGAAAQEYFSYNVEDLATSELTEEQKALATAATSYEDTHTGDENYFASNLMLKSNIRLMFAFRNVTADMTAEITYINHWGVSKTITIDGSDFTADGSYSIVTVEDMVVADGRQDITCTIYEGETVVATATDSVESYAARKSADSPLFEYLMKFSDSAYHYFHN